MMRELSNIQKLLSTVLMVVALYSYRCFSKAEETAIIAGIGIRIY